MPQLPLPFLIGPTASGKSGLAMAVAQRLPVEIVNLDAVALYRELDIGSAKPTLEEQQLVKHHLINVANVTEPWSVGHFVTAIKKLLPTIYQQNKLPLMVGGSMMYYAALTKGLSELPATTPEINAKIVKEEQTIGLAQQYQRLKLIDPVAAQKLKEHDRQRIWRALAVYEQTGRTLTWWQQHHQPQRLPYHCLTWVIDAPISLLRQRIQQRFNVMMQQGWLSEVKALFKRYGPTAPLPLTSIGYRELWDYCAGRLTLEEASQKIVLATGQLAKRQKTWLRRWPHLKTFTLPLDHKSEEFFYHCLQRLIKWIHA